MLLGNGSGGFTAGHGQPVRGGNQPFPWWWGTSTGMAFRTLPWQTDWQQRHGAAGERLGRVLAGAGEPVHGGDKSFSVAVGDFNGDGIQDLATANYGSNNVTVLLGNGSGGFTAAPGSPFAVGTVLFPWRWADFNGDGIEDLATANNGSNNVTVLLGAVVGTTRRRLRSGR